MSSLLGLPVRHWRETVVNLSAAPPEPEQSTKKRPSIWDEELPYGMPSDTHLLPPHSQSLLRTARAGHFHKRLHTNDSDEDERAESISGDEDQPTKNTILARSWRQTSHMVPDSESGSYLAKRHKGTITLPSKFAAMPATGVAMTRVTVRRIDAAGNPYTQEVTLAEGEKVDGEIISTSVVIVTQPTPATVTSTLSNTSNHRRRPPPPKKKKGPGRGRRKKILESDAQAANANGDATAQQVQFLVSLCHVNLTT